MTAFVIIAALALAAVLDKWSLGPRWLSDRLAFLLALLGFTGAIVATPAQRWAQSAGQWVADQAGRIVAIGSPQLGAGVRSYAIGLIAAAAALLAIALLLPARTSKYAGEIVTKEMSSSRIWGLAITLALFASSIPGAWGDLVRTLMRSGTDAAAQFVGGVF